MCKKSNFYFKLLSNYIRIKSEDMGTSRVDKYSNYRNSLIKEGAQVLTTSSKSHPRTETLGATTTLPLDQVIETIDEENDEINFYKKQLRKKYLTITILSIVSVVLIAVIAIVAIVLFRR